MMDGQYMRAPEQPISASRMTSLVLPNTSNFLGVALVINRYRDGPRFVFHYPAHIRAPSQSRRGKPHWEDDDQVDDGNENDGGRSRSSGIKAKSVSKHRREVELGAAEGKWSHGEDQDVTDSGSQTVPWEYVAGFQTKDLENLLKPGRAYHKKLFQVSLDAMYCVSYPIHVAKSGIWELEDDDESMHFRRSQKNSDGDVGHWTSESVAISDDSCRRVSITDSQTLESDDLDEGPEAEEDNDMMSLSQSKSVDSECDERQRKKSSMNMFNLVFFLNPKKHEAKSLIKVMCAHVIKEANMLYQERQQASDFVWKESKKILALKDRAREVKKSMGSLWQEVLESSSLAKSMQALYEAISRNRIAQLELETPEGMMAACVQIPVPFYISDLPPERERYADKGLWLTTLDSFIKNTMHEPDFFLKNFAMLLMGDAKTIMQEVLDWGLDEVIQDEDESFTEAFSSDQSVGENPDEDDEDGRSKTVDMMEMLAHAKPTLSLLALAKKLERDLSTDQIMTYARYLIYRRRAIPIPPLHARDILIVSPNADFSCLPQASLEWTRLFPRAPPLSSLLSTISVAPRPYKTIFPGGKHARPIFWSALGWLLRGGWVTQLCTFAYVVVWPEIVYEVDYMLEAAEVARARDQYERKLKDKERKCKEKVDVAGSADGEDADDKGEKGEERKKKGAGETAVAAASVLLTGASMASPGLAAPTGADELDAVCPGAEETTAETDAVEAKCIQLRPVFMPAWAYPSHDLIGEQRPFGSERPTAAALLGTKRDQQALATADNQDNSATNSANETETDVSETETGEYYGDEGDDDVPTQASSPAATKAEQARLMRVADRQLQQLKDWARRHARRHAPIITTHPALNKSPWLADFPPYVIPDASKPSALDAMYLRAIERRMWARLGKSPPRTDESEDDVVVAEEDAAEAADNKPNGETEAAADGEKQQTDPSFSWPNIRSSASRHYSHRRGRHSSSHSSRKKVNSKHVNQCKRARRYYRDESKPLDKRVAEAWPNFCRFFNGKTALERVALLEGMRRKDSWALLTGMAEFLMCVRHW